MYTVVHSSRIIREGSIALRLASSMSSSWTRTNGSNWRMVLEALLWQRCSMNKIDWTILGLCCAWLASLVWVDLNASPAFVAALVATVSGKEAPDWAQVWVGILGVAATVAAIFMSVRAGYLHQDRARQLAEAEAFTAAYLLARITGAAVIHGDRWTRDAALDPDRKREDVLEMGRYPAAWEAWGRARLAAHISNLERIDITTIRDTRFMSDLLTVRTRAEWYRDKAGPLIGRGALPTDVQERLGWAARDVVKSLMLMRQKTEVLRHQSHLSPITVDTFPPTEPPFSRPVDRENWMTRTAAA